MTSVVNKDDETILLDDDTEVFARLAELQISVIEIREMVSTLEAMASDVLAELAPSA
jgi:tetrahydromethanopterin S-methyltransferase subunit B